MTDNTESGYMEFMLPFTTEESDGVMYITIDFNVTEWFRNKYVGNYEGEEYPPANEDVCTDIARHFEKNHSFYFENGMVRDALEDQMGIYSAEDLKEAMDAGELRFIY